MKLSSFPFPDMSSLNTSFELLRPDVPSTQAVDVIDDLGAVLDIEEGGAHLGEHRSGGTDADGPVEDRHRLLALEQLGDVLGGEGPEETELHGADLVALAPAAGPRRILPFRRSNPWP